MKSPPGFKAKMKILLDSHIFLWAINNPELIGPKSMDILEDANSQLLISVVSIWELGLKYKKRKQPYSIKEMLAGVAALNAALLGLGERHIMQFDSVNLAHKDPFDMLLVAQSEAESCIFMTVDPHVLGARSRYQVADASK